MDAVYCTKLIIKVEKKKQKENSALDQRKVPTGYPKVVDVLPDI